MGDVSYSLTLRRVDKFMQANDYVRCNAANGTVHFYPRHIGSGINTTVFVIGDKARVMRTKGSGNTRINVMDEVILLSDFDKNKVVLTARGPDEPVDVRALLKLPCEERGAERPGLIQRSLQRFGYLR